MNELPSSRKVIAQKISINPTASTNPRPLLPLPPGGEGANMAHEENSLIRQITSVLSRIKNFFDYLGASRETPPTGAPFLASPWWLGLWWGLLIGLILLFCGQTSKFIYIDF